MDRKNDRRSSAEKMNKLKSACDSLNKAQKNSEYADVRRLIAQCRLNDADELLDSVGNLTRCGEWCYLKALVLFKRGFSNEARVYAKRAVDSDKDNGEFIELYDKIEKSADKNNDISFLSALFRFFGRTS